MTLRQKQSLFTKHVALLILKAYELGYEITLGEAYRSPAEAERLANLGKGLRTSLHISRLAIDLQLFKDGRYLTDTADYRLLGEWWEQQHSLARWGGRFGDGNHFSFTHLGKR